MEIFQAIRKDHEKQRALMESLIETSGDSEHRKKTFEELKEQLDQHAVAEERYFYAPLIKSDKTIDDARHGIAEHHEIEELVDKIAETDMSSPAWLQTMKTLQERVLHHLDEEEKDFFEHANKVLNDNQKNELADKYLKEMQQ
ncbi:hemerythrin domain-containing protein [Thalassotalea sp. 1_MG-2023]|uniref:hemerythrin domain-containing protein n=1 Tax=Thalassotalea sp. 1_MG-2023 TaxID=3062680 RepID=UPI0026E128E4|nr:hemerythrin domain-containing protein [Thalassotalea sp. 1_MG-2023]MDO6427698.1 hemerythrin domain-containing protein [Thalassotalea sp. 1_MG-2023]